MSAVSAEKYKLKNRNEFLEPQKAVTEKKNVH